MRKLMILASMLALALFVAAPALAQDSEEVGVCHYPPGNPENGQFISADESSYDAHVAHGDQISTQEECEGTDDADGEDVVDADGEDVVDDGDDGAVDDGDDTVIDNENNNFNNNENENNNFNYNENNQFQNTEVIVNLANYNQNVNYIVIGGTKVYDDNKDGYISYYECKDYGVSKSAAWTWHKKAVVEKDYVVEDKAIVTADTAVVTKDVVTKDVAVVTSDTTTKTTAVLPETGGASLLALGAGALLVAGGLLARRIVR